MPPITDSTSVPDSSRDTMFPAFRNLGNKSLSICGFRDSDVFVSNIKSTSPALPRAALIDGLTCCNAEYEP